MGDRRADVAAGEAVGVASVATVDGASPSVEEMCVDADVSPRVHFVENVEPGTAPVDDVETPRETVASPVAVEPPSPNLDPTASLPPDIPVPAPLAHGPSPAPAAPAPAPPAKVLEREKEQREREKDGVDKESDAVPSKVEDGLTPIFDGIRRSAVGDKPPSVEAVQQDVEMLTRRLWRSLQRRWMGFS
ncbi:hypothetical protein B0H14DRAFT_334861 [Mycena olivaceomarginata]|nr:hypothetical protein B0H14DRAFT_334861 [Mycena olivaceomarginata]